MTNPGQPEKILLIRTGALGDTVLLLPLLRLIRTGYPNFHLEMMTHPEFFPLVLGADLAHEAHPADLKGVHTFYLDSPGLLDSDATDFFSQYDWVISIKHDLDRIFETNMKSAGAKNVLTIPPIPPPGFSDLYQKYLFSFFSEEKWKENACELSPPKLDIRLFADQPIHPKIGSGEVLEDFIVPSKSQDRIEKLFKNGFVTLHPGSGSRFKNWSEENFQVLMDRVIQSTDLDLLVILGSAEGRKDPGIEVLNDRTLAANNLPIPFLSALLKRSRCHVGNDSGISHLAAGLDCPTICLFGPTSPAVWKPVGDWVSVVSGEAECSPCRREVMRSCPDRICLSSIQWERVYSLMDSVLSHES